MKMKILVSFIFTVFVLSFASLTSADGITKRVKFARGKSSATLSGAVVRGDRDTYLLGARAGQTMSVRITSIEKNAVFQIESPSGEFLDQAGDGDDAMSWSGRLPESGDYRVIVGGTRGNASYRITLSIK